MTELNHHPKTHASTDEVDFNGSAEISFLDIVNFLQESWKKLAIASLIGAVLGLSSWFFLGSHSAEYVLLNSGNNSNALNMLSWKVLQKSLPNLANQMIAENKVPDNKLSLYTAMSSYEWWKKNAVPSYALSKADVKDLGSISKDLESATTTIVSLSLNASGNSKEQALKNVKAASEFLHSGAVYLQLRSTLNGYERQVAFTASEVQQKIFNLQVEMGYQEERARQLERLQKRFSGNNSVAQQVFDVKDSSAKYLPIQMQIIAAYNDINASKESLERLQKRIDQIAIIKIFLAQALPLQYQTFDGLVLNKQLLEIESNLRTKLDKNNDAEIDFLNNLHGQLLSIQMRFSKELQADIAPTWNGKKDILYLTVVGLALALSLMLLVLLGRRVGKLSQAVERSEDLG